MKRQVRFFNICGVDIHPELNYDCEDLFDITDTYVLDIDESDLTDTDLLGQLLLEHIENEGIYDELGMIGSFDYEVL